MASSKTYTWAEFERGMKDLPQEVKNLALGEIRENMFNLSRILETVSEARAYDTAQGTKPSTGNTHTRGRVYGMRLKPTIQRFKNKNNALKAYAVIGNLNAKRGGAIYAPMQLGGYRPGNIGRNAIVKKRRILGKDYFAKAYQMAGNQVQNLAMRKSISILDKYLNRI